MAGFAEPRNNYNNNIKDHWSCMTIINIVIMKSLKYYENYQMWHRDKWANAVYLKNGTDSHALCKVAISLQFSKKKKKMWSAIRWSMPVYKIRKIIMTKSEYI